MGRCRSLGSLKSFVLYGSQLSGLAFHIFSSLLTARCRVFRMAVWYPELFFLGALRAQKFTFGGPESRMAMTSLFIGVAGNNPFHTPQSNWL